MSSLHCTLLLLLSVVIPLTLVSAYPCGPPTTACAEMFPSGHDFHNATNTTTPYTLTASVTSFNTSQTITLVLSVTTSASTPNFKGMFVQARKISNCVSDTTPIGTFSIPNNDNFLKLMSCSGGNNNAVSQKNDDNVQVSKTFTWTAPSTSTGHIFFRATVVSSEYVFWTNVYSAAVRDVNYPSTAVPASLIVACPPKTINTPSPSAVTPAPTPCATSSTTLLPGTTTRLYQTTRQTGSASSMTAATSLLFAAFVIVYAAL